MIPIPYGTRYFVTLSDRVNKTEVCQSCKREFIYTSAGQATGSVLSFFELLSERTCRERATEKARRSLTAYLAAPQIVACPGCGWYQPAMVGLLKRRALIRGSQIVGALVALSLLVAVVAGLSGRWAGGLALATVSIGAGLVLARQFAWDPNSMANEPARKARAEASCGMTIAKYQAMVAAESAKRQARDVQIAAVGSAAALADVDQADSAAARKQARLAEQRRRRRRSLTVTSIIGIGLAAVVGVMLDASIYGAHRGEDFSHLIVGGLIGPAIGLLCFFAVGEEGHKPGYAPATRRISLPIGTLVGLTVCGLLSAYIAGETAGRTTHLYLLVVGCEALTLAVVWLFGWMTGK